jgi:hypothetical protein
MEAFLNKGTLTKPIDIAAISTASQFVEVSAIMQIFEPCFKFKFLKSKIAPQIFSTKVLKSILVKLEAID